MLPDPDDILSKNIIHICYDIAENNNCILIIFFIPYLNYYYYFMGYINIFFIKVIITRI